MILINELYRKFELLKNCSKKNERAKLLEEFKSDELFLYVLEFLMNVHKVTGISTAKLNKELYNDFVSFESQDIKGLIDYILADPTGKNEVVKTVQMFIEAQSEELQNFVTELVTKKYKCGMTAKFVCEVLPGLVQLDHQVMLASKFKGELRYPVQISLKLDGVRNTMIINHDGSIKHLSRQGKEVKGLKQINSVLKNRMLEGYVLDGELIKINKNNLPSEENFKETISIVNSKDNNKMGLEFVVFDIIPLEDYLKHSCEMTYKERFRLLVSKIGLGNQFVRIVPIYGITNNVDEIYEKLDLVTSQGQEGLMLNSINGIYKFGKRSNDLMKVKKFNSCDIECINLEEGEGKYEGTLGKIVCNYKGYELRVGSGFTDEQRDYYWIHPEKIIGHLIEIKYFEESTNEQGGLSLRFPTFVQVRDDKDDESYE